MINSRLPFKAGISFYFKIFFDRGWFQTLSKFQYES